MHASAYVHVDVLSRSKAPALPTKIWHVKHIGEVPRACYKWR